MSPLKRLSDLFDLGQGDEPDEPGRDADLGDKEGKAEAG